MRIRLLYFATFKDVAGRDSEDRQVAGGAKVSDLWRELTREMPGLLKTGSMPPAAVNREYTGPETVLADGDEVAFLPPVAGG
ncbi:MAG: MoaD/ThiS family protein [Acidobacteriota bacterium]